MNLLESITNLIFFWTLKRYIFYFCSPLKLACKNVWLLTNNSVNHFILTVSPLAFMAVNALDLGCGLHELPGVFHYIKALKYLPEFQLKNDNTVCPMKDMHNFVLFCFVVGYILAASSGFRAHVYPYPSRLVNLHRGNHIDGLVQGRHHSIENRVVSFLH